HRAEPARAGVRAGGKLRQRVPAGAAPRLGAGLPLVRNLRIADLREPLDGAAAPVHGDGGAVRRGPRRAQLGELAGPIAGRAVVALPRTAVDDLRMIFGRT